MSAATTTADPSAPGSTEWFDAGPANRYAAFDLQFGADKYRVVETVTTNAGSITYTLEGLSQINGIALFGLAATNIRVVATVATTGDVLDVDYALQDATAYIGSMWRWMFIPQSVERKYINLSVNIPQGSTVEITISHSTGTAQVGTIAMGAVVEFGTVTPGTSRTLRSRSIKKTEGLLTSLLRRTPSAKVTYQIVLQDYEADPFWRVLDDLDGVGAVFSGPDNAPELSVYGFINTAQVTAVGVGISKVSMEVESL
ncbi:hypothetical protein JI58_07920 [Marinosulfonomonas sp. PRT-SC04]|nr:hypothetical protein JI58_07920 [Marinosulfonomonas sp. PRT-SC04]